MIPYLKKTIGKNGWWSGYGVGLEFKSQYSNKLNKFINK
jgi:hypothetical protein